ncbi:hypothetical protein [Mumia sp. ZJ430]|uniref:hypothetical protein n=1 Tax=Mumia sp. ZJ430 TaxID=2708083 RepID=UPI0014223B6A|nr:hypothetical protein [Mumia sp. ZJ430]
MLRNVPRLPAVMVAAALSGLLLMLGGTASASSIRSHATSSTDVRPTEPRLTVWKAAIHKIDVATRAHHEKSGLGPELAALPASADLPGGGALEEPSGSPSTGAPSVAPGGVLGRAPPR